MGGKLRSQHLRKHSTMLDFSTSRQAWIVGITVAQMRSATFMTSLYLQIVVRLAYTNSTKTGWSNKMVVWDIWAKRALRVLRTRASHSPWGHAQVQSSSRWRIASPRNAEGGVVVVVVGGHDRQKMTTMMLLVWVAF